MDTHYYLRGESLVSGRAGRDAGQRIPLDIDADSFALGLKSRVPLAPATIETLSQIRDREAAPYIPRYNIRVLRSDKSDRAISTLRRDPAVDFATPVVRHARSSGDPMYLTNRFIVQFLPAVTLAQIERFNADRGVSIVRPMKMSANTYLLQAPSGDGAADALDLANEYFLSGLTRFSHPDFVTRKHFREELATADRPAIARDAMNLKTTQRARRAEFSDRQWHLKTARVTDAWSITQGDAAIAIAILDDGVDLGHAEFAGKLRWQHDYEDDNDDANPKLASDKHGTACAGVATAAGVKASGAAPGCGLIAVRTPSNLGVADEAQMFQDAADNGADVISCSWGPGDGTGSVDPLPDATRVAIHYCQTNGRGGRGIPVLWAAGNGNESVSNDGYASNAEVIAVAASTSQEQKSWYSDFGPEIAICAPSSGDADSGDQGIFTTDRHGSAGYNAGDASKGDAAGDYYASFGGTSSAAPLAAGIVGLMLSANPQLTAGDVRRILRETADRIGAASDYDSEGHSDFYGHGRVNALKAVKAAQAGAGGNPGNGGNTSKLPTISAPARVDFGDASPTFEVDPGSNGFYQVEVATRAELFDAAHESERGDSNYHASWNDGGFLSQSGYSLPDSRWQALKQAERLYYRVWTSSSDSDWADVMVSLDDANWADAPSIEIVGGVSGGGENPTPPSITAPASVDANGAAPSFDIDPGSNTFFQIEVASRSELFDSQAHESERDASNYFASWEVGGFLSQASYALPDDRWQSLCQAERLYYRVWTSSRDSEWADVAVSVDDADHDQAPSIEIVSGSSADRSDRDAPSTPRNVTPVKAAAPFIAAAESAQRHGDAPVLRIEPNGHAQCRVELTTRAALFGAARSEREIGDNFYASPALKMPLPAAETTWTIPDDVWRRLGAADRLFYRAVIVTADGRDGPASTPDSAAAQAPSILVVDARLGRTTPASSEEDGHDEWRWQRRH